MRWIVGIIIVVIALMILGGWLYFRDTGGTTEVIIDKKEIQQDTEEAVEEGSEFVESAVDELEELGETDQEAPSGEEQPESKPHAKKKAVP